MGTMTINVPEELWHVLGRHPEINWDKISENAVVQQLKRMALIDFLDDALSKSEFTEKDSIELSRKIKESRLKDLKEQGLV